MTLPVSESRKNSAAQSLNLCGFDQGQQLLHFVLAHFTLGDLRIHPVDDDEIQRGNHTREIFPRLPPLRVISNCTGWYVFPRMAITRIAISSP
jgi:hypothetical protein